MTNVARLFFPLLLAGTLLGCGPAEVKTIEPRDAAARIQRGEPLMLVDMRSDMDFEDQHIAGAKLFDHEGMKKGAPNLPRDKWLALYCACPHDEAAIGGAITLRDKHGFDKVLVLKGGIIAWFDAGLPLAGRRPFTRPKEP